MEQVKNNLGSREQRGYFGTGSGSTDPPNRASHVGPLEAPPTVSAKTEGPLALVGPSSSDNLLKPVSFCKYVLIHQTLNLQSSIQYCTSMICTEKGSILRS